LSPASTFVRKIAAWCTDRSAIPAPSSRPAQVAVFREPPGLRARAPRGLVSLLRRYDQKVETFVAAYLAIGFVIGFALFGWAAMSAIRRHGLRGALRSGRRTYIQELPLYWRVPVASWMFVITLPLIAGWVTLNGDFDAVGAISVFLLWMLYLALLRWHYKAKARARALRARQRNGNRAPTARLVQAVLQRLQQLRVPTRHQEVSGVGDGNRQISAIHNIDRIATGDADETIPFREGGETRYGNLVPFGLDSNGNEWCFIVDTGRPGNEYDVAYFDAAGRKLYGKLSGFTEWLSRLVGEQDDVIRTLYDDGVLYEERMLG
jgi:hypothetical protein